jgi:hypothetical protein
MLDLILLFAGGAIALGVPGLPRIGRIMGRVTGKLVKLMIEARRDLMNDSGELSKLQKELSEGLSEINMIKYELRSEMRFRPNTGQNGTNPTPLNGPETNSVVQPTSPPNFSHFFSEQSVNQPVQQSFHDGTSESIQQQIHAQLETPIPKTITPDLIFYQGKPDLQKYPFAVNFDAPPLKELYDQQLQTDHMSGGADLLFKNDLEQNYSKVTTEGAQGKIV